VLDAIDAGDSAAHFYLAHALLEQTLAAARENQRRLLGVRDRLLANFGDEILFPLGLPLTRRTRLLERSIANA
jgi:hypothetical protein